MTNDMGDAVRDAVSDAVSDAPPPVDALDAAWSDPKLANVVYHDWEAATYDDKWSISYDDRCIEYARDIFDRLVGDQMHLPTETALEIGGGTGFFLLNLMQSGVATSGTVTDISQGMVDQAVRNAEQLGLQVSGQVADVEELPFDDASFDLVLGHAFLHHIPDVDQALREITVAAAALAQYAEYRGRVAGTFRDQNRHLPREIAKNIGGRKIAQMIPIAGAAIGAGINYWFTTETAETAFMLFRALYIERKERA